MKRTDDRYDRRTLVSGVGVALLGVGLAGCAGPGGGGDEGENEDGGESEENAGGGGEDEEEGGGYNAERDARPHQMDSK